MIALYFTVEPKAANEYRKAIEEIEADEAAREQQQYEELEKYVKSLSKLELQEQLLNALLQLEEERDNYW